ncbi:hypothetical protein L1049_005862 [Liquidambar formosana]|uniref:Uncharacterized protein n=1 Tax=Liquidambar formosana TaxID=63359 RepID=A0AAP0REH7_LIQFO
MRRRLDFGGNDCSETTLSSAEEGKIFLGGRFFVVSQRADSSGVDLWPSEAREVMPVGLQVVPVFTLEGFVSFHKTWSKCASGPIATSIGFCLSRKCLIGGSSFLEISFLFLLSIALSGQLPLNDQYKRPNANFS